MFLSHQEKYFGMLLFKKVEKCEINSISISTQSLSKRANIYLMFKSTNPYLPMQHQFFSSLKDGWAFFFQTINLLLSVPVIQHLEHTVTIINGCNLKEIMFCFLWHTCKSCQDRILYFTGNLSGTQDTLCHGSAPWTAVGKSDIRWERVHLPIFGS